MSNVQKNFDFKNPAASVSELVKAYGLIQKLEDKHWKTIKLEEIKKIIAACSGLYLEAVSDNQEVTIDSKLKLKTEVINRSAVDMNLMSISSSNSEVSHRFSDFKLRNNKLEQINIDDLNISLLKENYTQPYYLKEKGTIGMYRVDDQNNIGKPDIIRNVKVTFNIEIEGVTIPFEKNVIYKYNDDVKGEVYQPLDIVPIVTSSIKDKVYIFPNNREKSISVVIKSGKENVSGTIHLDVPTNWEVSPAAIPFKLTKKGEEQIVVFSVTPSKEASEISIKSIITVDGQEFDKEKIDINYSHIYKQMVLKSAEAKAIKLNIKTKNEKIVYIMGAGDEVPKSLVQMGYEVTILKPEEISTEKLQNFDVVITGIRAYNVVNALAYKQNTLLDFVKSGKTMIVQYNTLDEFVTKDLGPFPFKVSRDRVTEENATVRFLAPEHPILNYPNKITTKDFEGWKQEQGLYYPSEWDKNYTPIISSNDKGETAKDGAILVANYGKGHYIYTGISFFRELPEGVAGAFRLIANMIAIGK